MSNLSTQSAPRRLSAGSFQDGPVLLATKPFGALDAPLAVAQWLAAREERELRVVSVFEADDAVAMAPGAPPLPMQYHDEERAAIASQLQQEVWFEVNSRDVPQVDVIEGRSLEPIVDAARASRARVIVIGTGRHDAIGRYIYGERALQILSIADRPVLVVPRNAVAGPVSVAVVAVDFSKASLRAARAALPMLSEGGRLILVHVKAGVTLKEDTAGWWNDVYERRCADLFAQFRRQLPSLPSVSVETRFLRGDPVRMLLEYADACGAGLIACGRLGHSLIERVFVGSVSSNLVRQASCPVLVAPELPTDSVI